MKISIKIYVVILLTLIVIFSCGSTASATENYRLFLGDREIISDAAPYMVNNRLLVPIRTISEATGAVVVWNGNAAIVYRGSDKLVLMIGSRIALYNDIEIPMDVAPVLRNGKTYLPLRFISEWLGLAVDYDGDTIRLYFPQPVPLIDTMDAPRGNTNANLNTGFPSAGFHALIWQNRLFYRQAYSNSLVSEDLETREQDIVMSSLFSTILIQQAFPRYFNIWNNQLYVNINDDFVIIDAEGTVLKTVIKNVGYCQIHDDWLYFLRESDGQLCRRLLIGGNIQPLGVYRPGVYTDEVLEFVITDQHIYVNDGSSILRMDLDGSGRRRLLLTNFSGNIIKEPTSFYLVGLEYADGHIYFSLGGNTQGARICQLNLDGTGLKEVVPDGANEINIVGDLMYYTKLEPVRVSLDEAGTLYCGVNIARVKLDGSEGKILTQSKNSYSNLFDSITAMPDGSIYYREWEMSNADIWHKMEQPE